MRYDFDTPINRRNTFSFKWDCDMDYFGRDDVIPMWVADMDFACAPCVVEAVQKRAAHPIYGYGMRQQPYYDAVMGWLKKRHGFEVKYEHLAFAPPGVIYALNVMLRILTKPGDRVMVPMPNYDPLFDMVTRDGRKLVETPLVWKDGRYTFDFADMEAKAASGVKVLVLSSPHNPTGRVWTEEELRRMMELCLKHHVLVVSDEIHSDLIFHGKRHIPTASLSPEIAANVVTGISATKTFNLAGLQASTAVFPNAHMKAMFDKFWTDMDIHRNNAFSVTAMEVAFNEGEEWLEQLLPYISANFDFVVDYCEKHIPKIRTYAPDATYLMWLDCRDLGLSNEALHDFMIQKAKLGLNDGCAFGRSLNGYMRLNAACPRSVLEQAMRQLEAAVNSL